MKFSRGDRVEMTDAGMKSFRMQRQAQVNRGLGPGRTKPKGLVTGFSNDGKQIYVMKDGTKSAEPWNIDYWEKIRQ